MRSVLVVAVGAALVGCFAPAAPEGAPCGEGMRCPSGQTCSALDNRCYTDDPQHPPTDATLPPGVDAPSGTCTPQRILTGGTDPTAQGWTVLRTGSSTITGSNGVTTLTTSNNSTLLLVKRNAFVATKPWAIEMVVEVVASGGHTANNAAIALMSSFHDPLGDDTDRRRMLFLETDAFGWGEGGLSVGETLTQPVTYRFESSGTNLKAIVMINGTSSLSSSPFTSNGTIAIGDQSADPGLDSTIRIHSVDIVCP